MKKNLHYSLEEFGGVLRIVGVVHTCYTAYTIQRTPSAVGGCIGGEPLSRARVCISDKVFINVT